MTSANSSDLVTLAPDLLTETSLPEVLEEKQIIIKIKTNKKSAFDLWMGLKIIFQQKKRLRTQRKPNG